MQDASPSLQEVRPRSGRGANLILETPEILERNRKVGRPQRGELPRALRQEMRDSRTRAVDAPNSPPECLHRHCCHDGLACCFKLNCIWVCLIQRPNDGSPPVTRGTVFGRTGLRTVGLSSGWPIPERWGLDGTSTAPNRPEALLRSKAPVISIRDVTTLPMQRCAGLHSVRTMVVIYLPNNRTRAWPNSSV